MNTVRLLINGKKIFKEVDFKIGINGGKTYVSVTALTTEKSSFRDSTHIDIKKYISPHSEKVNIDIYFPDGTISKEKENIIYLLERQIRMAEKALNTPTMGRNNYDDFKNQINNNTITIKKLRNDTTRKS